MSHSQEREDIRGHNNEFQPCNRKYHHLPWNFWAIQMAAPSRSAFLTGHYGLRKLKSLLTPWCARQFLLHRHNCLLQSPYQSSFLRARLIQPCHYHSSALHRVTQDSEQEYQAANVKLCTTAWTAWNRVQLLSSLNPKNPNQQLFMMCI